MRACRELLKEEILAELDAYHERMMARMYSQLEKMEACLGKTEATDLETNPESEAEHEVVPKEEAAVKTFGALKKRYWDRHLAVGRRGKPKKRIQGDGLSRKNLVAALRGMTLRAIPARRKGHCSQGQGKDKPAQRTQKGQTFGMRRRAKPKGIME
jgi:hypothetical protein